jgi:hypothetical protein
MGADLTFRTSQLQMLFGYLLFSVDTNGISCFLETTKESLFCFSKSQRVIQHCSKYLVFEEDVFESKSIIDKTLCQNLTLRKEITDCGRGNTANRQRYRNSIRRSISRYKKNLMRLYLCSRKASETDHNTSLLTIVTVPLDT